MSNTELTQNLNTILDNFQMVVNSGKTRSVHTNNLFFHYEHHRNVLTGEIEKEFRNIDIQSDLDGLYPINLWEVEEDDLGIETHRSKEILMDTPVSDKEKELMKEWFCSDDFGNSFYEFGEDLEPYMNGVKMDYKSWWRFTDGLLWRFYYYLLVNIRDENLETINEELSILLMDMMFSHHPPNRDLDLTTDETRELIVKGYSFFPGE